MKKTKNTFPETNIAPKNRWLEYLFPFGARPIFRCELLVSGRVFETTHLKPGVIFRGAPSFIGEFNMQRKTGEAIPSTARCALSSPPSLQRTTISANSCSKPRSGGGFLTKTMATYRIIPYKERSLFTLSWYSSLLQKLKLVFGPRFLSANVMVGLGRVILRDSDNDKCVFKNLLRLLTFHSFLRRMFHKKHLKHGVSRGFSTALVHVLVVPQPICQSS